MMSSATMLKYMMIKYFIHFAICNVSLPRHHEVSYNSSVGRFCTFDQMVYHLIIVSSCSKDFFHNLEKESLYIETGGAPFLRENRPKRQSNSTNDSSRVATSRS